MGVDAVVFDVGGVLLFPNGDLLADALDRRLGLRIPAERFLAAWIQAVTELDLADLAPTRAPGGQDHLNRWLATAGVPPDLLASAIEPVARLLARPVRLWSWPGPGASACLEALRASGLRLACVSNGAGTVVEELAANGLADFFEVVVDSGRMELEKPDARIFRVAAATMAVPAAACLYVGDTVSVDVSGAIGAGMSACHLDTLGLYPGRPATFARIRSLGELCGVVATLR